MPSRVTVALHALGEAPAALVIVTGCANNMLLLGSITAIWLTELAAFTVPLVEIGNELPVYANSCPSVGVVKDQFSSLLVEQPINNAAIAITGPEDRIRKHCINKVPLKFCRTTENTFGHRY